MLHITIDKNCNIAIFEPDRKLTVTDFQTASNRIDEHLQQLEKLDGLIILSKQFPGWETLGAMKSHIRFIKNYHKKISAIALVTDTSLANIARPLARLLLSAKIKTFKFGELDKAKQWISEDSN